VTLPYTQPQRPVSGFAIATLGLGIMGIVLPAVICGIVALGQIRGGSYSDRGMVMARLLISAAWMFPVAAFAAYVIIAWLAKAPPRVCCIVAPSSSPGRMARRHPDRTASHHRYPPAPPIRPRPIRPHQPVPELGRDGCQTRAEQPAAFE